jgi:N-acetylglucosamine kinase
MGNGMILCFDIGASRIKAGLASGSGVAALGDVPTPLRDFDAFVAALAAFLRRDLKGIAISIAGVVDPVTGEGTVANIPCIHQMALAPALQARLGLPVLVLNDADCFALAEARQGAGRGHATVFGVILGSGVGGGLVIGGRLVTGAGGFAGEWGHGPVIRGDYAFACGCGQVGCIDTVGGARGVERLWLALGGDAMGSLEILTRWHAGDALAGRVVNLWEELVAGPLAMVLNVTGATVVPVGGGLANDAALIARLDGAVRARVLRRTEVSLVVPAQCAVEPGLIGAAEAGLAEFGLAEFVP